MKKIIAALLACTMAFVLFAACGSGNSGAAESAADESVAAVDPVDGGDE